MRTYLILKEKAAQWQADPEIQSLIEEIYAGNSLPGSAIGAYSSAKVNALKGATFDRNALGERGLAYERLDQLTVELLLGVR
jgi:xylose isomerase